MDQNKNISLVNEIKAKILPASKQKLINSVKVYNNKEYKTDHNLSLSCTSEFLPIKENKASKSLEANLFKSDEYNNDYASYGSKSRNSMFERSLSQNAPVATKHED